MRYGLEFPFFTASSLNYNASFQVERHIHFSNIRYSRPQQETGSSIETVCALSADLKERHSISRTRARELLILSVTLLLEG